MANDTRIFVRPAPGRLVRTPISLQPLAPEGADVVDGPYWQRRLRDGDVVEGPPPADAPEAVEE